MKGPIALEVKAQGKEGERDRAERLGIVRRRPHGRKTLPVADRIDLRRHPVQTRDPAASRSEPVVGAAAKARAGSGTAIVTIEPDGTIKLPPRILRKLSGAGEVAVWAGGDTIILKRLIPVRATEIAERAPGRPMPLREIVAEVHKMRREKRRKRA